VAIARDTSVNGGLVNPNTSLTWSHTCTGTNLILFVGVFGDSATDSISGVKYAGVSMTLINKVKATGDRWCYLFVLVGPSTGVNNVVVSASASIAIDGASASYTGAKQTGQPDSSNTGTNNLTSITVSTTVVAANCWLFAVFRANVTTGSAGTGSNQLQASNGLYIADSNGTVATGSRSMSYSNTGGSAWAAVIASFSPSTGGSVHPWWTYTQPMMGSLGS